MRRKLLAAVFAAVVLSCVGFGFTSKPASPNVWRYGLGGSYAFHFTGAIVLPDPLSNIGIPNGPCSSVGIIKFDRRGGVSGTAYNNFNGMTVTGIWEGMYTVDNGIVTLEISSLFQGSLPVSYELVGVLADDGNRMEATFTRVGIPQLPEGFIGMVSPGTMIRQ